MCQERSGEWTLWLQQQVGTTRRQKPVETFTGDLELLAHRSLNGWEAVGQVAMRDQLPRILFKRRL